MFAASRDAPRVVGGGEHLEDASEYVASGGAIAALEEADHGCRAVRPPGEISLANPQSPANRSEVEVSLLLRIVHRNKCSTPDMAPNGQISAETAALQDALPRIAFATELWDLLRTDANTLSRIGSAARRRNAARRMAGLYVRRGPVVRRALADRLLRMAAAMEETRAGGTTLARLRREAWRVQAPVTAAYFVDGPASRQRQLASSAAESTFEAAALVARRRRGECLECDPSGDVQRAADRRDYCVKCEQELSVKKKAARRKSIERFLAATLQSWEKRPAAQASPERDPAEPQPEWSDPPPPALWTPEQRRQALERRRAA